MPVRNLRRIFSPQSVAVIGASARPNSVGQAVLKNLRAGNSRRVFAVNPRHAQIGDLPCWPTIADLPEAVDLAVVCTPAPTVPEIIRQCGERGIYGVVVLSAGFREVGAAGRQLEAAVREEAAKFPGLRILGPNCLGFMAPHVNLNASFVDQLPPRGSVAFISQSGALGSAVLDWAALANVGFSYFVSLGNMIDVTVGDVLDYLTTDPHTESVVLYVESISEARQFLSAARAFTRSKPIIAYKAGRFAESAKAAASHTGALAGVDAVYEAAFARAGIVRVFDLDDLFDCAELLARRQKLPTASLAIITNAGGPGVMATDALIARRGTLATLAPETMHTLDQCLPASWSHGNPVDIIGDATPERFRAAVAATLKDPEVSALLVILSPQAMSDPTATAQAVIEVAAQRHKPVLAAWMGGARVAAGIELFRRAGVPVYSSPEKAVRAFMYLVSYSRRQELLYETPQELPVAFTLDRSRQQPRLDSRVADNQNILTEPASKAILESYGIPISRTLIASSAAEAREASEQLGFPVVLKLLSPDITHKSDVGGVVLNVLDTAAVAREFEGIVARAQRHHPHARIDGVTVQPMLTNSNGHELIVGAKRDPIFGMVMLVGMGGIAAEVLQDHALELPPLNERLARRMVESLRAWPILRGYRGRPGIDVDQLIETLMRFSYLIADHPEIVELDVNPLIATPGGVTALDARIVVDPQSEAPPPALYSHLAIRPYPEEFVRTTRLKDGESVILRPIKPEDEPLWHAMVRSCSPETIHARFHGLFKTTTHEMAARYCFIDYDREMAIVAERMVKGRRALLGVGRLIANVDHTLAEYAVLVADAWQGLGLGSVITDYCLEICERWGVKKVVAETTADNQRMIAMFQHRGFVSTMIPPNAVGVVKKWS